MNGEMNTEDAVIAIIMFSAAIFVASVVVIGIGALLYWINPMLLFGTLLLCVVSLFLGIASYRILVYIESSNS